MCSATQAHSRDGAIDLDEIASWGKFPRFCVNTYRWGDKFFNGYDSTYVAGTGYKMNAKIRTESWTDYYGFIFDNKTEMAMVSDPSTSVGLYLTYMAVSVGYDMNISKYFSDTKDARKRWSFNFNCMLFSANLYFIKNDVGTTIRSFDPYGVNTHTPDFSFDGINNTTWGLDAVYYFTHKRYSHAAAFNYSRIQLKSGGSFFAGISYSRIKNEFDFSSLPEEMLKAIPETSTGYDYTVNTHNYFLKGGYGYNYVINNKWIWGSTVAPLIGCSSGYYDNETERKTTFATMLEAGTSIVYNSGRWFAGATASGRFGLVRDRERSTFSSIINLEISAGIRFNLP